MLGLKREGNVSMRMLVKMQVVTLSEFCRIVKKRTLFYERQRGSRALGIQVKTMEDVGNLE